MELLKAMLIYMDMIHIRLALIALIHIPGLPETFQLHSMLPTKNKARPHSTHWMSSKEALSIRGVAW
jgi:hypothetical protein